MRAVETAHTLVHVSDLHVGDPDKAAGSLDAAAFDWWRHYSMFDGFLGHSHEALSALVDRFDDLRDEAPTSLVVTGDLSAYGRTSQLDAAREFLTDVHVIGPGNALGLRDPQAMERTIPGNHDHWPGKVPSGFPGLSAILGGPNPALASTFAPCPRRIQIQVRPGLFLVIVAINSDHEVSPRGVERLAARGRFRQQAVAAARIFGPPVDHEIRVLLLHHSHPRLHSRFVLGIERGSRAALDQLIEEHDVAAVLSGHVHDPITDQYAFSYRNGCQRSCVLACAGTATQLDEPPGHWNLGTRKQLARFRVNTLLVHRLRWNGAGIWWECTVETRHGGSGRFRPSPPAVLTQVWPR